MSTRFATLDDDLISGVASGAGAAGVPIVGANADLPVERLRYVNGEFIDAAEITTFYADERGYKHALPGPGRRQVICAWDAPLMLSEGAWEVATASVILSAPIKAECTKRIMAVANANAQMNMTASSSAQLFSVEDQATFVDGLLWIDGMRAKCRELIAAEVQDYADDRHWLSVPPGVRELASRH